jgi:Zn-dependent protease with chaperone function
LGFAPAAVVTPGFTLSIRRMTARLRASRRDSSHLPASETWIQTGGLRKPESCRDALLIVGKAYPKAAVRETLRYIQSRCSAVKSAAMRSFFKCLAAMGVLAALSGCATNPITGRSQFMVISEKMAIGESAAAYSSMMGDLGKKKKIEADSERAAKVREITDRLIAQAVRFRPESASWKWEVQVINDPKQVNAFCMAGGKMAIYSGMWEKLKATDDEIAHVMGHEIGHALANHTQERMSIAMTSQVAAQVAAIALASRESQGLAMTGAQMAALFAIQLPNSRESETEADQIGIELAARAGYDPQAAVTLWEKMAKLGGKVPEFMSTHPSPENRAARLKALGERVQPLYAAAKSGGSPEAPKFLGPRDGGANERVVTRPGEISPEEYAARHATDTLTFLAADFERFKDGKARFDCTAACAFGYAGKKSDWKALHEKAAWRDLAVSVMQVGYLSDLSYFMLAEAAKGLGFKQASAAYYRRALEASGPHGCGDDCEGFEVATLARAALGN